MTRAARQAGVSLIELVIVIVALAAGIALLGNAYLSAAQSIATNEDIQLAWQSAQACADNNLGRRRKSGTSGAFANVALGAGQACPSVPAGVSATFTVTDTSGAGVCNGLSGACRQVAVSATKGTYTASLTFVIADY
ncbi:MAG: type II secretion system protein [Betaproteobacteria bacterium]